MLEYSTDVRSYTGTARLERELDRLAVCSSFEGIQKIPSEKTIGFKRAQRIFLALANARDISLLECLFDFLGYCERNNFPLAVFDYDTDSKELKSTIEGIRVYLLLVGEKQKNKADTQCETPQVSIQATVAINNEIDKIRRDLDLYPYGKDKLYFNDNNKNDLALSRIDKLLSASSHDVDLLALKAFLYVRQKKLSEALMLSESLYLDYADNLNVGLAYIAALGASKDYGKAISISEKYKKTHSKSFKLSFNLAVVLKNVGRHEKAINEFLHAISLDKECIQVYRVLATTYTQLNQHKEAGAVLKSALLIAPCNEYIIMELMGNLARQNKKAEIPKYAQLLEGLKNGSVNVKYAIAAKELVHGNIDNAEAVLRGMIAEMEDDPLVTDESKSITYFLLATIFQMAVEETKDNTKNIIYAKECYLQSLKFDPNKISSLDGMAKISFQLGVSEEAKKYLDKISDILGCTEIRGLYGWDYYVDLSIFVKEWCADDDYRLPLKWCCEQYYGHINGDIRVAQAYINYGNENEADNHIQKALVSIEGEHDNLNEFSGIKNVLRLVNVFSNKTVSNPMDRYKTYYNLGVLLILFDEKWPSNEMYLQKAIGLFEECSGKVIKKNDAYLWFEASLAKGDAFREFGRRNDDSNALNNAISVYKGLLVENTRFDNSGQWVYLNRIISDVYWDIGCNKNDLESCHLSIEYRKGIFQEILIEDDRKMWSSLTFDIAEKLAELGDKFSNIQYIEEAIDLYKSVLNAFDDNTESSHLAELYNTLGDTYNILGAITQNILHFKEAEIYYRFTTKINDSSRVLSAWVGIGNVYLNTCEVTRESGVLADSIAAFKYALKLPDAEMWPDTWAYGQQRLGSALQKYGFLNSDCQYYIESVTPFNLALQTYQKLDRPRACYECLHDCGLSFLSIYDENNDVIQLNYAFDAFSEAIKLVSIEGQPESYALTHEWLANVLYHLGEHKNSVDAIQSAILSLQECQCVYTKNSYPEKWGELQREIERISPIT